VAPVTDAAAPSTVTVIDQVPLAPSGKHYMSVFVQYCPYQLADGEWNDARRGEFDAVVSSLAIHNVPDQAGRDQVALARKKAPYAYVIPANQRRKVEAAELVNLLRLQGVEVHRATTAFIAGGMAIAAGDYVVRLAAPEAGHPSAVATAQMFERLDLLALLRG